MAKGKDEMTREERQLLDDELRRAESRLSGDLQRSASDWARVPQADDLQLRWVPPSEWTPANHALHALARRHRPVTHAPDPQRAEAERRAAQAFPPAEENELAGRAEATEQEWRDRQAARGEVADALRRASAVTWVGDRKVEPAVDVGDEQALRQRLAQLDEDVRLALAAAERARARLITWRVARDRFTAALVYELSRKNGH